MITKMTKHQQLKFLFTEEGWLRLRKVIPDSRSGDSGKTLRALTQKIHLRHFGGLLDVAAGSAKIVDDSTARLLKIVNLFYITFNLYHCHSLSWSKNFMILFVA